MKRFLLFFGISTILSLSTGFAEVDSLSMSLMVGEKVFTVKLADNPTVQALADRLPFEAEMKELNGNEKYHYLTRSLPEKAVSIGTIHTGDVMLYGDRCIVVFYKTFPTSYRYTPVGAITDVTDLENALGTGDVRIQFEKR